MVEFLQYFENEWFLGFFTKSTFFKVFILCNFDTFYKFGCNFLEFQWIFDLKTANGYKIPQLLDATIKFRKILTSDPHPLKENRPSKGIVILAYISIS